jgi:hypothetical protein
MFKRYRIKKLVKSIMLNGVRKRYQSDVRALTKFDLMVDAYLALFFVATCELFNVNPKRVNTVPDLLRVAYAKLDKSKEPLPEDVLLIEWLNSHTFPMFYTLVRFSIVNHNEANIATMDYLKLLIGNTALNPINKGYSRTSLMLTADYFTNVMKSIITENVGEAKVTGHSADEPAAGLH